jgi:transposase-like protein
MGMVSAKVHVNTMEGFWSLLRNWLRPHRGISQEKLPFYLGFFEFVHNVGKRGKTLLHSLIEVLVKCFFFKKQKAGYSSYQQKLG